MSPIFLKTAQLLAQSFKRHRHNRMNAHCVRRAARVARRYLLSPAKTYRFPILQRRLAPLCRRPMRLGTYQFPRRMPRRNRYGARYSSKTSAAETYARENLFPSRLPPRTSALSLSLFLSTLFAARFSFDLIHIRRSREPRARLILRKHYRNHPEPFPESELISTNTDRHSVFCHPVKSCLDP